MVNVLRSDIALTEGLTEAGLSPEEITRPCPTSPGRGESLRSDDADDDNGGRVGTAIIINIALFLLLQTYGGWVVSGVTREKASRVVEVLLSTLTARQLMFGKIIGIGTLALLNGPRSWRQRSSVRRSSASMSPTGSGPSTSSSARAWFMSATRWTAPPSPPPGRSAAGPRMPKGPCSRSCSR